MGLGLPRMDLERACRTVAPEGATVVGRPTTSPPKLTSKTNLNSTKLHTNMSDPSSINGGSAVAMAGKDCVAIACDLRLGSQSLGLANNFEKIFSVNDKVMLGLTGLASDVTTLSETFRFKNNMYELREERKIEPSTFANLVSSTLYEKRFGPYFIGPIVAGLDKSDKPFICGFDLIGCINLAKDFIVSGTATDQLYGMCESLYEPNLEAEDLFETISQALLNAVDRDTLSGWGAVVYVISKGKVERRVLKTRQD